MAESPEVFISYSREDAGRVLELAGKLREAGVSLWIDQGGIDSASPWSEQIVNALDSAKVLLLMVSESAVQSHNVTKEVALVSERKGHILPVHLQRTAIPASLKYQLAGLQHVEYFDESQAEANLKAILRSLERIGVRVSAPPVKPAAAGTAQASTSAPQAVSGAAVERGALAVMPFDNISSDSETDYFSDGLTEELIARLSSISEIELVSRWATKQMKERKLDPLTVSRELGARYIVGGSVRRFQDSVRITVQLVDAATNRQLWGNTYKGKLDDIFDIQEQVAQQIAEALKLKLSFSERVSLTKRLTGNVEAYDLYLRGQDYLYRMTKRSTEYAIQLFEKAIELDPRFGAAYAACSSAYGQMYQYFGRKDQWRERAQELSLKALMYDPSLPEAYAAMALSYFTWGKLEEAEAAGRKAVELDPENHVAQWTLGRIHFTNGQMEQANVLFRRVMELKPKFFVAQNDLAMTYEALNRLAEARATRDKLLEMLPIYLLQNPDDAQSRLLYAVSLAEANRRDDALREGATALELNPEDARMLYNGACLFARLGEGKRALELLHQAVERGFSDSAWMLQDSDLASLRGEPEFIALAQR